MSGNRKDTETINLEAPGEVERRHEAPTSLAHTARGVAAPLDL